MNETNQSRGTQQGNSNIREDRDDEDAAASLQRETQSTTLSEYLSDNIQVKLLLLYKIFLQQFHSPICTYYFMQIQMNIIYRYLFSCIGSDGGRNVRDSASARLSASFHSQRRSPWWNRCNFAVYRLYQHYRELDLPAVLHCALRSQC